MVPFMHRFLWVHLHLWGRCEIASGAEWHGRSLFLLPILPWRVNSSLFPKEYSGALLWDLAEIKQLITVRVDTVYKARGSLKTWVFTFQTVLDLLYFKNNPLKMLFTSLIHSCFITPQKMFWCQTWVEHGWVCSKNKIWFPHITTVKQLTINSILH